MRRYRDKKAAKTRQAIAARTDARHQVMLDSLPSDEMRQLVIERRPRDEKDNIPFWDTVRWARKVGDAVERRRGKRPQYEVWKAKLERAVRLKRTVELIRVDASTDHKGNETPAERKRASVVGAGAVTHLTHKALALYQLYDLLLQSLKSKSLQSFGSDVVTVYHVRKLARRARDYMRAYSWGHTGLEVETAVKKYKRTAAPSIPISSSSASSRMDDFHVYYCSRPNLGYVRVGRELPRPVATRSYTLAAGALQTGRPVTYTLTLSLFA
jgi:hypothetical protein